MQLAGKVVDGVFECGFDCYGVPVGTDKFITEELMSTAREIVADAEKATQLLSSNRQALWSALRLSILPRFQYWCQHVQPSLCEPVAAWLDIQLWTVLEAATGLSIPRGHRGEEGDMVVDVPVRRLAGKSFQHWAVRLPIRLRGWGFRSLQELCGPAYLATLETSIPRIGEISPIMSATWGWG